MKEIAMATDLQPVVAKLKVIAGEIQSANNMRCSINATGESLQEALLATAGFLERLPSDKDYDGRYTTHGDFTPTPALTQFQLPLQVNFVAMTAGTVPYSHEDFAPLRILGNLLTTKFLHREIREKGGAYGGGASAGSPGLFQFYSYRDPNSMKTLEAFERSIDWAINGEYSLSEIDESKLSVFQQVDSPAMATPANSGQRYFLNGVSEEMRQKHREQLMDVKKSALKVVAEKYLLPSHRLASTSFIGNEVKSVKNNPDWVVKEM